MRDGYEPDYFLVFDAIFCKQVPLNRQPPVVPQRTAKAKVVAILAAMLLGVSTAAVAFTVNQRGDVAKSAWEPSATFVTMPGVAGFEDALY